MSDQPTDPSAGTSTAERAQIASAADVRRHVTRLDAALGFMATTLPPVRPRSAAPFAGEPLLVKDLDLKLAGAPLWRGNHALHEHGAVSRHDDALGRRLREFGFDIVGRTKSAEFGLAVTTEPLAYGPVRNPWDHDRSAGGSSGGSACAVAARAVRVAHGTDLGGSLRIPAAHCGVFALKPGLVRPATTPTFAAWNQHGFLASKVCDLRRMLSVLGRDETSDASRFGTTGPTRRVRVGVLASAVSSAVELGGGTVEAVERVADKLSDLGHDVLPAHPGALEQFDQFTMKTTPMLAGWLAKEVSDAANDLGRPLTETDMEPGTAQMLAMAALATPEAVSDTTKWLRRLVTDLTAWWDQFDILLSPTVPIQAPRLGWMSDPATAMRRTFGMMQYTAMFNASGHPAVNVPYVGPGGLPCGAQLVGTHGSEAHLLDLAEQLIPGEAPTPPLS
ncbi:amidase family protein [Streptomyces spectabilis]|uniref:Amidase n=1 Tax=Streptomyces spectabilis TaxID=68270 RepID=A0A5P2X3F9_STRST|nr:amidase [Streptomyces spectabilis]MBB5101001.1 amidase [Streptomyces spectabilis]QEV57819.1 amidase [Streptomyces spectabilis]GGV08909.1 amidase [Streptomyces spectabilis]